MEISQLVQHPADVGFRGGFGPAEPLGDRGAGQADGDLGEDLAFPRGQLFDLGRQCRLGAAAAERAGLLWGLPGNVLLAPDVPRRARIPAGLPQPYTTAEAAWLALATTRRVVITLLEWLDRQGVTLRLADDRRIVRQQPGSP